MIAECGMRNKTAKIDELVISQFFTQRHKGTKKGLLKIFMFFFVSSACTQRLRVHMRECRA